MIDVRPFLRPIKYNLKMSCMGGGTSANNVSTHSFDTKKRIEILRILNRNWPQAFILTSTISYQIQQETLEKSNCAKYQPTEIQSTLKYCGVPVWIADTIMQAVRAELEIKKRFNGRVDISIFGTYLIDDGEKITCNELFLKMDFVRCYTLEKDKRYDY